MDVLDLGPLNLTETMMKTDEGLKACQQYGRAMCQKFLRINILSEEVKEMRMNNRIILFCLVLLILSAAIVFANNKGQAEIILNGGSMGNITFPHHLHHGVVNDCMVCHKDFAQESGSLQAAKDKGALKKKQVMNNTCLKCHRDRKKAGEKYGPVSCSGCHKK